MQKQFTTKNPEETRKVAGKLGGIIFPGAVIALKGGLGAGKTQFTKGLARGLGIDEPVTSPTFTLVSEYAGRLPLYHFDVYRLKDPGELYDLGFEEYFYGEGVTAIEWADLIEELLPEKRLEVSIRTLDENTRTMEAVAYGRDHERLLEEWYRLCMSSE